MHETSEGAQRRAKHVFKAVLRFKPGYSSPFQPRIIPKKTAG